MTSWAVRSRIEVALVATSLFSGTIYPLIERSLASPIDAIIKGMCIGLLTVAALFWRRNIDGWLLVAVMAAGTAGDVLLALPGGFKAGAVAFGIGHILSIWLYLHNRSSAPSLATRAGIMTLLIIGVALPRLLLPDDIALAVYGVLLTAMVASALASRFDRRVAIGALMFLASDALIAVRMQLPQARGMLLGIVVWWLYYFGQLLIFWFVSKAIRSDQSR